MIFDHLSRAGKYINLHPGFDGAFRFLNGLNASDAPGRRDLADNDLFANIQDYFTKPPNEGFWEAHRAYIDIQILLSGTEKIGFSPIERMIHQSFDKNRDLVILKGEGDFLTLSPGCFAIFFPTDAHMPGIALKTPENVRKVVVKIKV